IADHLKTGVVSWLLGTAVKAGLDLPAKFDLKGIIQLIGSMLGLTWDNIRTRVTRKGVPDEAMSAVETSVPVAKNLAAEGPAGAVKEIQAEAGDLKATILGKLTTYLIPTVLIAGITWIISLLNPASAFVRAVKGIIDIVTFIVTQGAQIADFVNAVLDAVIAIANGGQAGVPKLIEAALASSVPLLIGFLAALLGIGGLANKVKSVFQSVSRPVTRAIDKIVDSLAKKGKELAKSLEAKTRGGDNTPQGKRQRLDKAMSVAVKAANRFSGRIVGKAALSTALSVIRRRYGLESLTPKKDGEYWTIHGRINPAASERSLAQVVGEMKWYKNKNSQDNFDASEKAELDQLILDSEAGKFTKAAAYEKYKKLVSKSKARRENYSEATRAAEEPHTVKDHSGKSMDEIEGKREKLRKERQKINTERTRLAKALGRDDPDKIDKEYLEEQRLLGRSKEVDDFLAQDAKYKARGNALNKESEKLGMIAARDFGASRGAVPMYEGPPGAPGTFDLAMLKPGPPPSLFITEAKGGSSQLGTRSIEGNAYQQGHSEYLSWMLKNDKGFRQEAATRGLLASIEDGTIKIEYHLVMAPGGRKVIVQEFIV
ncbi:HPC2 multi-domain protein, partial [Streptomyces anulatus]